MELLIIFALVALLAYQARAYARERQRDRESFAAERKVWAYERRELNNRLQIPAAAPFMDLSDQIEEEPHDKPYVPFDDDEAFHEAQERYDEISRDR